MNRNEAERHQDALARRVMDDRAAEARARAVDTARDNMDREKTRREIARSKATPRFRLPEMDV